MSNIDKLVINSPIKISGLNDDKPYIELTSRLCWLDEANLNGVGLSSKAEDSFQTLIDMPVVAKLNNKGDKFCGHEVSIDDKGNVKFNTSAYGVHTDVWVEDSEVEIPDVGKKTLPCLFAKAKIWKRFSNVVDLVAKKFGEPEKYNGGLWSSWELQGKESHLNDAGKKIYDTFDFLGNCLIDVAPAYFKTSKGLAVASVDDAFENELEIAYLNDIKDQIKEEKNVPKLDLSSITMEDLYRKLDAAISSKTNHWAWIRWILPEEHRVIARNLDGDELDCFDFSYSVNENNEIELSDPKDLKLVSMLTTSEKEELDTKISTFESDISTLKGEIQIKNESLIKSAEEISTLKSNINTLNITISELSPFKEKFEEAERLKIEAELAQQREDLKTYATKGGFITPEEIESSEEIKSLINNLDSIKIKAIIAERFIKKLEDDSSNLEISSKEKPAVKTSLIDDEESNIDPKKIMKSFLNNN